MSFRFRRRLHQSATVLWWRLRIRMSNVFFHRGRQVKKCFMSPQFRFRRRRGVIRTRMHGLIITRFPIHIFRGSRCAAIYTATSASFGRWMERIEQFTKHGCRLVNARFFFVSRMCSLSFFFCYFASVWILWFRFSHFRLFVLFMNIAFMNDDFRFRRNSLKQQFFIDYYRMIMLVTCIAPFVTMAMCASACFQVSQPFTCSFLLRSGNQTRTARGHVTFGRLRFCRKHHVIMDSGTTATRWTKIHQPLADWFTYFNVIATYWNRVRWFRQRNSFNIGTLISRSAIDERIS